MLSSRLNIFAKWLQTKNTPYSSAIFHSDTHPVATPRQWRRASARHLTATDSHVFSAPNGAGKSTLLRTLTGLLRPLAGTIEINGSSLESYSSSELSKLVSVVLTDRFNLPDMTARQLVALGRSPYTGFWGRLSDNDEREVDEVMALNQHHRSGTAQRRHTVGRRTSESNDSQSPRPAHTDHTA